MAKDLTKISINLPTELINQVKEIANSLNIPVTQVYVLLLNVAIHQAKEKDLFNTMADLIKSQK